MKRTPLILIVVWLSACTHHPRRVDCDQHLEAINPAHPIVKTDGAKTP
jgi:hypothetical protein